MEVIGLGYKAGVGKDWIASNVLKPHGFMKVAFAWPLKWQVLRDYKFTFEEVFRTKPFHVRDALQWAGVAAREKDENYWVNQLATLMQTLNHESGVNKFVITDVRFRNEVAFVQSLGGSVVNVRHGDREYPLRGTAAEKHSSETELDSFWGWDASIINNKASTSQSIQRQLFEVGVLNEVLWGSLAGYGT